ncbi:MAG TPA: TlpA disulfide reductase family protein [Candidatus Acidoferrales bacterium]|jgi:peroxiredoxin|nr:TlpA disulfide reductase family protein [Candidatus Acidoferrales bacterium]
MFRSISARISLAAALLVLCAISPARIPAADTPATARQAAPNFTLKDSNGAAIKLSDYKGKVVLLDFWATWCYGCGLEIPWFVEYQKKYKGSGLAVVGVSMDDDGWSVVKPFIEAKEINYAVVLGNKDMAKLYKVESMPVTFLIDREGKIAESYFGMVDRAGCEAKIQSLLKDDAKPVSK